VPKLTKHRLICETLKSEILNGTYEPKARIPPEIELTVRFGASRMTVNRAIKELQMAGYVRRTRGSGTYVLERQVSEPLLMAIMIPGLPDAGIYHRLVRSVEETAFSLGYSVILCNADFSWEKARAYVKELVSHKISGIFFSPIFTAESAEKCVKENTRIADMFVENRIPFLCIDSMLENFEPQNYVIPDNEDSSFNIVSQALSHGHRKCLLLHGLLNASARLRILGARRAFKTRNLPNSNLRINSLTSLLGMKPRRVIKMFKEEVSLICCLDDLSALQVINFLKDLGIRVPEDVSIISHDDLDFAESLGLTTVHQDLEKEGEEAVNAMHRLIKGEISNIRQLLPSRVIFRRSLGPAPGHKGAAAAE